MSVGRTVRPPCPRCPCLAHGPRVGDRWAGHRQARLRLVRASHGGRTRIKLRLLLSRRLFYETKMSREADSRRIY